MAADIEEGFGHLDLGLGEPVMLGEASDPSDEVKPDAGSQNPAVDDADAGDSRSDEEEPPFAGGAGEGDDLPTSGLR